MAAGINGHSPNPGVGPRLSNDEKATLLADVEAALDQMSRALQRSGFTLYEIGSVSLATRYAISSMVKDRQRST